MFSKETLDTIVAVVFTFGFVVTILLILYFQPFCFRQLIHCYKNKKQKRIRWILFILLTNLLGAFWYWRLTPMLPNDPDKFDKKVDDWLKQRKLSLDKSKNRLVEGGGVVAFIISLLWIPYMIAALLGRWIFDLNDGEVPNISKYVMIFLLSTLTFWAIKKMIELHKNDKFVSPWLVIPILQAKRGNRKEQMFFFGKKEASVDPKSDSIVELLLADFSILIALLFGFFTLLNAITLFQEFDFLFSSFSFTFWLLFTFVCIRSNSTIIFYNHPESVFFVLRHYKILSIITYFIPIVIMVGFLMMLSGAIMGLTV